MSISTLLVAVLTSGKVVKFEYINEKTKERQTIFGKSLNTNTGKFLDVINNCEISLNITDNTVAFVSESHDDFAGELDIIQSLIKDCSDIFSKQPHLKVLVIQDVHQYAPILKKCKLFQYFDIQSIINQDSAFLTVAKDGWKKLINEKKKCVLETLQKDLVEFEEAQNINGVEEIKAIIAATITGVEEALKQIDTADTYSTLVTIWPPVLLPRPTGA